MSGSRLLLSAAQSAGNAVELPVIGCAFRRTQKPLTALEGVRIGTNGIHLAPHAIGQPLREVSCFARVTNVRLKDVGAFRDMRLSLIRDLGPDNARKCVLRLQIAGGIIGYDHARSSGRGQQGQHEGE